MLTAASLESLLRSVRPGVTELMVHPGYVDDELLQKRTRLLSSRAEEVRLLCAAEAHHVLVDEGIQLVRHDLRPLPAWSYRDAS